MPHPIERLRWIARAEGAGPSLLAREAAGALGGVRDDPAAMVLACRRLIERHPGIGPIWWLAARVLAAGDPPAEAWAVAGDLESDPTPAVLAAELPEEVTATVVGWQEHLGEALRRRGDLGVLVVRGDGEGPGLVRRLASSGVEACDVPDSGLGAAVRESDLVLLEALALGPGGFTATAGSLAAAATGYVLGIPVWVVAGVGRVLPGRLWEALQSRLDAEGEAWETTVDVVPLALASSVVGPSGREAPDDAVKRADCPITPELLRWES